MHPSIQRARALLDRLDRQEVEWAIEAVQPDPDAVMWQSPEPVKPKPERSDTMPEKDWSAWERWCDDRITRMIGVDSDHFNAIAEALSLLRRELRKEFQAELAALRADMNVATGIQRGEIAEIKKNVA